jgi:hypothetical protein
MDAGDEWAKDPSVRMMRRVFEKMESTQSGFLAQLRISFLDERIRLWRERTLVIFERMWAYSMQNGISMNEKKAADIYIFSLARVMGSDGMKIPERLLPCDPDISKIFGEAFT